MASIFKVAHKDWTITATARKIAERQYELEVSFARVEGDACIEHTLPVPEFLTFDSARAIKYARFAHPVLEQHSHSFGSSTDDSFAAGYCGVWMPGLGRKQY